LVSPVSAVGSTESAWAAMLALMLTTWPPCCLSIWPNDALGQPEESGQVDAGDQRVIVGGVVGEGLGDEDARVIDQGVDAAEAIKRPAHDPVGGGLLGDVALDREDVRVLRRLDAMRIRHDRPASLPVRLDEAGADTL
jgi:hypothetical protein